MGKLVMHLLHLLGRDGARLEQGIVARRGMFQCGDVVADGFQDGGVVGAIGFELGLEGLKLGDRFDQPSFIVQDFQLKLLVAEDDQRLARRHRVAGLHQKLRDLASRQGIEIDGVLRHDRAMQRHEIVEGASRHAADGDVRARDRQAALRGRAQDQGARDQNQKKRARHPQRPRSRLTPPGRNDRPVHHMRHAKSVKPGIPTRKRGGTSA
ncbi:MAG: hypothetical protein J0H61_07860 [Alphaproteobacteria bacterium]|nr:hypothetical protein [Alphaproteobacteria bacterium]